MQKVDNSAEILGLSRKLKSLDLLVAAKMVSNMDSSDAVEVLSNINPHTTVDILNLLDELKREALFELAPEKLRQAWLLDRKYKEDAVGTLMELPQAIFKKEDKVRIAIDRLKVLTKKSLINYGFLVDDEGHLEGVFAFRELLFADDNAFLEEISIMNPFYLLDTMSLNDAMQEVVTRHYPSYPVCNSLGKLVGLVRGHVLFEVQAFNISAQAGAMQGVDKEERISTSWIRALKFRHPWLQLNLLTAFIAAAVVGVFQNTLDEIIVLAAFLPVLAGQSGNTGCQSLAVTLRGVTLGELKSFPVAKLIFKEAILGLANGAIVGLIAGGGMWYYAASQGNSSAFLLGIIVWSAMIVACMVSGVSGATIPLVLKKLGADPATASSIFLTTMTDVVSMGVFLSLASMTI
jgi:magnesium transporter